MKGGINMTIKHDKFVSLAEKRVNNTLKNIKLIGNLSNKNNYHYSDEEVKKIINVLRTAIKEVEQQFNTASSSGKEFKL